MSVLKPVRTTVLLILCTGLLGLLAACGDSATSTPLAAPADTPTTAAMAVNTPTTAAMTAPTATTGGGSATGNPLQNIGQAMQKVTSYHFTMTTDMGATGTTTAEGDIIPPDKMSMTSSVDMGGQKIETKLIRLGSSTWTNVGGQWIKTDIPAGGAPSPADLTATLGTASGAEDLGDDTVDGKAAHHYRYSVTGGATGATSTEVWVDKDTNFITQYKSTIDAATGKITVTMKLSKFNDPSIKIEPPQ